MAFTKNIKVSLDLESNVLHNLVVESFASAPENPKVGFVYFDTTKGKFGVCIAAKSGEEAAKFAYATTEEKTSELIQTALTGKLTKEAFSSEAIAETIADAASASADKFTTEKAVRDALDEVAEAAKTGAIVDDITITRDAVTNALKVAEGAENKGLEVKHFKTGVVVDAISATGDSAKIASEKAVRTAINSAIAGVYKVKGSVDNFANLPADAAEGDVYNVKNADKDHGVKAGDNVVWVGAVEGGEAAHWDVLSGVVDLTDYSTTAEINALLAKKQKNLASSATVEVVPGEGENADTLKVITTALSAATTEAVGVVELATADEVKAGTADNVVVTPAGAKALVSQDIEAFRTAAATLENKTISAENNTISGLSASNFASAKVQLGAEEAQEAAVLVSKKYVDDLATSVSDNASAKKMELSFAADSQGGASASIALGEGHKNALIQVFDNTHNEVEVCLVRTAAGVTINVNGEAPTGWYALVVG